MLVLIIDPMLAMFAALIGRPLQAIRARRLLRSGRVRCTIYRSVPTSILGVPSLSGVAEVSNHSLRIYDIVISVESIEPRYTIGPENASASLDSLIFRPETHNFELHTAKGRIFWAVLAFQAPEALRLLGFEHDALTKVASS